MNWGHVTIMSEWNKDNIIRCAWSFNDTRSNLQALYAHNAIKTRLIQSVSN